MEKEEIFRLIMKVNIIAFGVLSMVVPLFYLEVWWSESFSSGSYSVFHQAQFAIFWRDIPTGISYNQEVVILYSIMFLIGFILNFAYKKDENFRKYLGILSCITISLSLVGIYSSIEDSLTIGYTPQFTPIFINIPLGFTPLGFFLVILCISHIFAESVILNHTKLFSETKEVVQASREKESVIILRKPPEGYCSYCGVEINDTHGLYCSKCGTSLLKQQLKF